MDPTDPPAPSTQAALLRVFSANAMLTVVGVAISFLLPLSLTPVNYGYWQLYALYAGYAGVFMFGFNDGVYLRYAGSYYNHELFTVFRSFRVVVFSLSLIGSTCLVALAAIFYSGARQLVLFGMAAYVLMAGLNGFCAYTNQNTLRFRQYSRAVVLERVSFLVIALTLVAFQAQDYWWYIGTSILACMIMLAYNIWSSRELFWGQRLPLRSLISDVRANFSRGFVLMIAVLLNQSMIVVGRLVVENRFGIEAFAGYSFALTVLNVAGLVMISIAQVMFPVIRRTPQGALPRVNRLVDRYSSVLGALLLFCYFPVWGVVHVAYGAYRDLLSYLPYLFPLVVFQGKFQLIVVNGFKIAGRMKSLFAVSFVGVLLEVGLCLWAYQAFGTVAAVVIASVLGYVAQYYLGLFVLARGDGSPTPPRTNMLDLAVSAVFVSACLLSERALGLAGWTGLFASLALYLFVLVLVAVVRRRRLASGFRELRTFLRK